ncbi:winged helix DNA-binding domain-containing protein [Listeria sp. FSL L7-1485]|uniref:Winged helix DNA-binding domain-containing protein n=1 Tax=Listeria immobilis TaxID=2713502 RepID=A0A7X0X8X3_9LIST|nr:winged helix DNA-binding domain-containing protein [Listeria immobilis]MBC1489732.1 winged helix DNA-binding domain-containing protein [Listeria immobilis]MBC1537074.1 winged helix DNA-binding domain-containing protein [Listeria immobilis]
MERSIIIQNRYINQKLAPTEWLQSPQEVVAHFGAIQAQNYGQSLWAVGSRLISPSETTVKAAINEGKVIRTWLLRGTIHLFSADDYHWMIDLTAPMIDKICQPYRTKLGLSNEVLHKASKVVDAFVAGSHRTRKELAEHLAENELPSAGITFAQLLVYLSSRKIICSGPDETYRDTRHIPAVTKVYTREEAIKELAKRYFQSHAPATLRDFCFWSGFTVADAKIALADFAQFEDYFINDLVENTVSLETIPLAGFDEWIIGYRNRSIVLDEEWHEEIITKNGIFRPAIITAGKVVAKWGKPKNLTDMKEDYWSRYIQFRNML